MTTRQELATRVANAALAYFVDQDDETFRELETATRDYERHQTQDVPLEILNGG